MSDQKKPNGKSGKDDVLPFFEFEDMKDEDKESGQTPSKGGAPSAEAPKKPRKESGTAALADFSDENDKTDLLPSRDYDPFEEEDVKKAPEAKDRSKKKTNDEPVPPKSASGKKGPSSGSRVDENGELLPAKPKEAIRAENKKNKEKQKKKDDEIDVQSHLKPKTTSDSARTIFIVSMCLLAPFALLILVAAALLFAALFTAALLLAGVLALALIILVVAGVVLALTGIVYGLVQMVSKSGFAFYAGQYELGLGLAITGITIILSSLLYAGATSLVPFLVKQLGRLIKFLAGKIKSFFIKIYKYSTQL